MTRRWIVTALGKDRPGIVAGVTKVLYQLGCNLEDSAMTRLESEFAIMLIFSTGRRISPLRLRQAFLAIERRLQLVVHLKPLSSAETRAPRGAGNRHLISVYGGDRPGIVFRVAELLARHRINVTDVHTHRSRGAARSLYLMLLEVEIPPRLAVPAFERRLKGLGKRLGVQVSLRASETEVL